MRPPAAQAGRAAAIARLRRLRVVVIDENSETGWRRFVEGEVGSELRRKLRGGGVQVENVRAAPS